MLHPSHMLQTIWFCRIFYAWSMQTMHFSRHERGHLTLMDQPWLLCICKRDLICIPRTFSTWGCSRDTRRWSSSWGGGVLAPLFTVQDLFTNAVLSRELLWLAGAGKSHSNRWGPTEAGGNAAGPCRPKKFPRCICTKELYQNNRFWGWLFLHPIN